jgi:hypothetical protein
MSSHRKIDHYDRRSDDRRGDRRRYQEVDRRRSYKEDQFDFSDDDRQRRHSHRRDDRDRDKRDFKERRHGREERRSRSRDRHTSHKKPEELKPKEKIVKEKPCFTPSGILAEFSNKQNGVVLKFTVPADASPPTTAYGLYPF